MVPYLQPVNAGAEFDYCPRPFVAHHHRRAAVPVALAHM